MYEEVPPHSSVYFMYRYRAFKAEPVPKFEKPATEKVRLSNDDSNSYCKTPLTLVGEDELN